VSSVAFFLNNWEIRSCSLRRSLRPPLRRIERGKAALRSALEPILDGLPTGPIARFPDVAKSAGRTRACRYRAFVPYLGSCAPAIDDARPRNRRVAPRTTTVCGSSRSDTGKGNCEQNCKRSHALLLQNPRRASIAHHTAFAGLSWRRHAGKAGRLMADWAAYCESPPAAPVTG